MRHAFEVTGFRLARTMVSAAHLAHASPGFRFDVSESNLPVERKLLHVNKKGRPVSQCPHCRSLRKNRSQHVKCDCHDKSHAKEDCPHLKDLAEAQNGVHSFDFVPS